MAYRNALCGTSPESVFRPSGLLPGLPVILQQSEVEDCRHPIAFHEPTCRYQTFASTGFQTADCRSDSCASGTRNQERRHR